MTETLKKLLSGLIAQPPGFCWPKNQLCIDKRFEPLWTFIAFDKVLHIESEVAAGEGGPRRGFSSRIMLRLRIPSKHIRFISGKFINYATRRINTLYF